MPLGLDFAVEEPGGAFKGPYKSESSLMTCEAELHGSVTRMVYSILSLIGSRICHGAMLHAPNQQSNIAAVKLFVRSVRWRKPIARKPTQNGDESRANNGLSFCGDISEVYVP